METKDEKTKVDYEKERNELFSNSKKIVDPRIQKTIDLIEKTNASDNQVRFEITTSYSGTMI